MLDSQEELTIMIWRVIETLSCSVIISINYPRMRVLLSQDLQGSFQLFVMVLSESIVDFQAPILIVVCFVRASEQCQVHSRASDWQIPWHHQFYCSFLYQDLTQNPPKMLAVTLYHKLAQK